MILNRLLPVLVLICTLSAGTARAEENARKGHTSFRHVHRQADFSLEIPGTVARTEEWPEVSTPRKFSFEAEFEVTAARVYLHLFDLGEKDGAWWLSEVMGFLFEPEVDVEASVTANGYDLYVLDLPGGNGVFPQTEALVHTPRNAFRFICLRCDQPGARDEFRTLVDSLLVIDR